MYNFFIKDQDINEKKAIITQDYNHIVNVLRMNLNDKIYVCNKKTGESYLAKISEITKTQVICEIINKNNSTESNIDITIFQGLPKSDKMETIIQKSTE